MLRKLKLLSNYLFLQIMMAYAIVHCSSILYSVGGGYLLASYIGKSSLSRFFCFRHFLLFPFGFHQLVHFFLTVESQDKVGHN